MMDWKRCAKQAVVWKNCGKLRKPLAEIPTKDFSEYYAGIF
jgi:hypothetical protein